LAVYTSFVYTGYMKNVTFSADEHAIERGRKVARAQNKTLNELFREWLDSLDRPAFNQEEFDALMNRVSYARAGRKFTREEMNER
jgi:uncharacterized protein (DUF1778 family)